MPDKKWKDRLKESSTLDPKDLARLNYRVAHKIKSSLSELDDIDQALRLIPEKNARRVLNDQMVAAIFRLAENMIRILGYVPVEEGRIVGSRYVIRSEEITSRDAQSEEFKIKREAPTAEDEARHLLLTEHIEKLREFADPETRAFAKSGRNVHIGSKTNYELSQGENLCRKWQEPKWAR